MNATDPLTRAYRYQRQLGFAARQALHYARADVADDRPRYPRMTGAQLGGRPGDKMRWIEDSGAVGLRFVGFADELANLGHTGWFFEQDNESEVYRGAVYRLPARRGVALYVVGYREGCLDRSRAWQDLAYGHDHGAGRVALGRVYRDENRDWRADPYQAELARAADTLAEKEAEKSREYSESANAGHRFTVLTSTIESASEKARALLAEMRAERRQRLAGAVGRATICTVLREALARLRAEITAARAERSRLLVQHVHMAGTWRDHLWRAFADGAGIRA